MDMTNPRTLNYPLTIARFSFIDFLQQYQLITTSCVLQCAWQHATICPMEAYTHIIGYVAATLTTVCFIPQVIKVVRDRETKGISLLMYSIYIVGLFGWLTYGILLESPPIIIANIVTISLVIPILVMKIKLG
jgi:MtN3 and saliva related transmembrane protein